MSKPIIVSRRTVGVVILTGMIMTASALAHAHSRPSGLTAHHSRPSSLVGQWQTRDRAASGVRETDTYCFLPDGLFTSQSKAQAGTLLGGLAGKISPDVRRTNVKGTYTVKNDVVKLRIIDFNLFGPQGQPVTTPGLTLTPDKTPTICRYQVQGDTLTLDKLDGTPPIVLTRQHS